MQMLPSRSGEASIVLRGPASEGLSEPRRGERLDIHQFGFPTYSGIVVATMPMSQIVWIRDPRTGERKTLSAYDCRLRRPWRP